MIANIDFRYIPKNELCSILGISRSTLERSVAEEQFPKPYKLGKRAVRWRSDEVEAYINGLQRMNEAYSRHNRQKKTD